MGFRFAGIRSATVGVAFVLAFAVPADAALAHSPQQAAVTQPAKAASAKPAAAASSKPASGTTPPAASGKPDASDSTPPTAAPAAATAAAGQAATAAVKPGDAATGQGKAGACGACHGADGNSTDPQYPKLAGQSELYIVRQLEDFKSGKRQNPIMLGMATPLSEQDMHDIGAYYASKSALPGVADQALVAQGEKLFREGDTARGIPACMACHGPSGRGNPGAMYPELTSQHAQYIEATLKAWHDGTTWGDDAHAQIMPAIAKKLEPKDIAALASYIEGLHESNSADAAAATTPR